VPARRTLFTPLGATNLPEIRYGLRRLFPIPDEPRRVRPLIACVQQTPSAGVLLCLAALNELSSDVATAPNGFSSRFPRAKGVM
jgi:hypothetical protein